MGYGTYNYTCLKFKIEISIYLEIEPTHDQ